MLKVLFVAGEAMPFVKTGGLGDVTGSLPKELQKQGLDVRVIIPKYSNIPQALKEKMVFKRDLIVPLVWRNQFCALLEMKYQGVTFYFVENEYYFKRDGIYGMFDDAERYAFFCRAVLESLQYLDFMPDILHCHDWHAAMVSVFLKAHYEHIPAYQKLRTLFTIHNLHYQGAFQPSVLYDILELDESYFTLDTLECNGAVNFMKGGLVFSDLLSTVSSTYAEEIQEDNYGEGLNGILRMRRRDLSGIVNGIDYEVYNPENDARLYTPYSWQTAEKKTANKLKLQEQLGLPVNADVPMLAMVSRLVGSKGLDLVVHVLDEILSMEVQLVILGTGEERYHNLFSHAAWVHPEKFSVHLGFDDDLAHKVYAASDLFLMPSRFEPCGIGQLIAMRYGSLPIVRETGGLKDTVQSYNEESGIGNGFSFANYNAHDMLYTIKRAIRLCQDKAIRFTMMKQAMCTDFSWQQSAQQYQRLYEKLLM